MNRDAYRHYPNDNCGDPDHDRILEAWYAKAEALLARSTPAEALDVDTVADAFRKMAKVGPGFDARIDSGDIGSTPLIRPSDLAAEFVEALSPHNREAEDTIAGLRGRGFGVVASPSAIEDSDDTPVRKAISE